MRAHISSVLISFALATTALSAQADTPAQWQARTSKVQVSMEQAIQKATQAVPGKVLEIELEESKKKGLRYEVQVLTPAGDSVEVLVNAISGEARQHSNDGKAKRKDAERAQEAKIDITQAIEAATRHTPGRAIKAELDNHWGTTTYEVHVMQADYIVMEIKVDAADGKIIRSKIDEMSQK